MGLPVYALRWLGGIARRGCDSCRNRPAIFRVTIGDKAFLVCWECKPE